MELRHLRYFVAVAESLHFGRAAARLRIAQPSLSHQIRRLEDEVQTSLLRRTNRRVEVTEAGRLFLQEARDIIARADHAAVMSRRMGSATARKLRVGIGYCTDQLNIAAVLSTFNGHHQDVNVETRTMSASWSLWLPVTTAMRSPDGDGSAESALLNELFSGLGARLRP